MIVPLWSHTSVILCKADLHIFLSRLALGTELIAMSASFWVLCLAVSSVMIDELYGGLLHSLMIISGYYHQHVACSFMRGALAFVL